MSPILAATAAGQLTSSALNDNVASPSSASLTHPSNAAAVNSDGAKLDSELGTKTESDSSENSAKLVPTCPSGTKSVGVGVPSQREDADSASPCKENSSIHENKTCRGGDNKAPARDKSSRNSDEATLQQDGKVCAAKNFDHKDAEGCENKHIFVGSR